MTRGPKGELAYSFACGTRPCEGEVLLSPAETQAFFRAGVLTKVPRDLASMDTLHAKALDLALGAEGDLSQRAMWGKLALSISKERMEIAGVGPQKQAAAPVMVNQVVFEAGDPIDRRLDEMFDAELVESRPVTLARTVVPKASPAPLAKPEGSVPSDILGGA